MTGTPGALHGDYAELVAAYFRRRRWFAGKGRDFAVTHVHALPWFDTDLVGTQDPGSRIEVVTVEFADGSLDTYQFPVSYRRTADPELEHALVGFTVLPEVGEVAAYDAVFDKEAMSQLYQGFQRVVGGGPAGDELTYTCVEGTSLPAESVSTVMSAEQSNTSIVFGEGAILKLFRRISPGSNPDIEIHEALTRAGCEQVAALLGWLHGTWQTPDGTEVSGDLGMLQTFLRTATDGWDLALASLRDLFVEEDLHPGEVGGDFAGESERLGEAVALVHTRLATLFPTRTGGRDYLESLADTMTGRLDEAVEAVPALERHRDALSRRFEALRQLDEPVSLQRVHGDLHLGQTLRTVKGWKLLDFEGEPAKSIAERSGLSSPLRDVAGMLRSFDYAAGATLQGFGENPQLIYRGFEWSGHNRSAFLRGYAAIAGVQLSSSSRLLSAFEADKAIYEAVYETRNRPSWVDIPLRAIARITAEE
jgi:maltokinase